MSKVDAVDASTAGYQIRNIMETDLDTSWKAKGVGQYGADDVQLREQYHDEQLRSKYNQIVDIVGDDEDPLGILAASGMRTSKRQTQQLPNKRQIVNELQNDPFSSFDDNEDDVSYDWIVEEHSAKLKSGKSIPVWKVTNSVNGMEIPKPFRIQEAAERIVGILNATGNVNDSRIKTIYELHDRSVSMRKKVNEYRRLIKEGQTKYKQPLQKMLVEVEKINTKLGV